MGRRKTKAERDEINTLFDKQVAILRQKRYPEAATIGANQFLEEIEKLRKVAQNMNYRHLSIGKHNPPLIIVPFDVVDWRIQMGANNIMFLSGIGGFPPDWLDGEDFQAYYSLTLVGPAIITQCAVDSLHMHVEHMAELGMINFFLETTIAMYMYYPDLFSYPFYVLRYSQMANRRIWFERKDDILWLRCDRSLYVMRAVGADANTKIGLGFYMI